LPEPTEERVRRVVGELAGLPSGIDAVSEDDDLFSAGMSSHASVNVMPGLENEFEIEFPDAMLERSVFESIRSMTVAVDELTSG
jgi:acyl carrier protein